MIEVLIIVALLGYIGYSDFNNRKERKDLLNRIIAKDNQELVNLELSDKTKVETSEEPKEDLVEFDDLDDKEYDKFILNKNG